MADEVEPASLADVNASGPAALAVFVALYSQVVMQPSLLTCWLLIHPVVLERVAVDAIVAGLHCWCPSQSVHVPSLCVCVVQVVKVLAEAGADLNLPENRGWTALMIAASRGCVESIEALLGEWGTLA